jgi:hypothetical protein
MIGGGRWTDLAAWAECSRIVGGMIGFVEVVGLLLMRSVAIAWASGSWMLALVFLLKEEANRLDVLCQVVNLIIPGNHLGFEIVHREG